MNNYEALKTLKDSIIEGINESKNSYHTEAIVAAMELCISIIENKYYHLKKDLLTEEILVSKNTPITDKEIII